MTKIYLIRHAEAEGNLYRRVQGHSNSDVTPRGWKQIEALSERFREISLDAIYSSDLYRTRMTATALTKYHDLPVITRFDLREMHLGDWENKAWGNVQHDEPEMLRNFSFAPDKWIVPGAERFSELGARMVKAVTEIAEAHPNETVAVVSHGMALRTLLYEILRLDISEIGILGHADNTSVSLLHYENGAFTVEFRNDNSHLSAPGLSTFATQTWWKSNSGAENNNLRLIPLDIQSEKELYCQCYAAAWEAAHGSLDGFYPDVYWHKAYIQARRDPEMLMKAYAGDAFVGLVELDKRRAALHRAGWISLLYIVPEHRRRGFSLQLIGHAIHVFRPLGRKTLRLCVSEDNKNAIGLYEHLNFKKIGEEKAATGRLYLMEKDIRLE